MCYSLAILIKKVVKMLYSTKPTSVSVLLLAHIVVAAGGVFQPKIMLSRPRTPEERLLLQLFRDYHPGTRPVPLEGGPTVVNVSIYLRSISAFDELRMEFTADMLLRQYWNDPRLAFEPLVVKRNSSPVVDYLQLSNDAATPAIWVPDIFFPTMRRGEQFNLAVPNRLTRIYPNGNILLSVRYSATFACDMDFRLFPFDDQHCVVNAGAFSSMTDILLLQWYKKTAAPLLLSERLRLPKFILKNYTTPDCLNVQATGNYSCLQLRLDLTRQTHFYIIEAFAPTTLFVVASWVSFWIDPSSAPARASLGCILMLSNVALTTAVQHNLPPVSYVKALDIWLGACICFVFLTLIEYGLVSYLMHRHVAIVSPPAPGGDLEPGGTKSGTKLVSNSPPALLSWLARRRRARWYRKQIRALQSSLQRLRGYAWQVEETIMGAADRLAKREEESMRRRRLEEERKAMKRANKDPPHVLVDSVSRVLFPVTFLIFVVLYIFRLRDYPGQLSD